MGYSKKINLIKMKVVFFATSEFAIPSLNILNNSKHEILAVFTKEAKKQGRGMSIQNTPVYNEAEKMNLQIFTPATLKDKNIVDKLTDLNADIFVIVSYGLLLPKSILNLAKFGCINIHPSLLPRWRGASPMQRALMEGDKKTGVCIIVLGEGLDDGDIIMSEETEITNQTTLTTLHDTLSHKGAELLLKALDKIENDGKVVATPQASSGVTYAKKIEKEEGFIDFNNDIEKIDLLIRTLSETTGTYFIYNGERIKIIKAEIKKILTDEEKKYDNGKIINKELYIKCSNGILIPKVLQREGKKALDVKEFSKGFKI